MATNTAVKHALVLAGGHSERMGSDKAALPNGDSDQLSHTVALASRHVANVYVSVRADQRDEPLRARFPQIVDRYPGHGPLSGIMSALEFHKARPWLVLACDLPALNDTTLEYLLNRVDSDAIATAYAAENNGLPEPLCAVWMPSALGPCHESVALQRSCPRKILIQNRAILLALPTAGALDNANTPADLARIHERLAQ
ncbi:MAG: NTP transferase domain-containing protein [Pseudomonadota bacterium]